MELTQEGRTIPVSVPTKYLEDRVDRVDGGTHRAQLFRVMIDDFSPVRRSETAALIRDQPGSYMTFVIGDSIPLDEVFEVQLWLSVPGASSLATDIYDVPRNYFEQIESNHELDRFATTLAIEPSQNIYAAFEAGESVRAVLSCHSPGSVLNEFCRHYFHAHGFDVEVNYRTTKIAAWKEIQDDISAFVGCLRR